MENENNYAEEYLNYLNLHKEYVQKAYDTLLTIIPDLFDDYGEDIKYITETNIKNHDNIKFDYEKLKIYGAHFHNEHNQEEYDKLIWEHINKCPHHFQHWLVFYTRDDIHAVEIPYEYIIEMICDWFSFSFYWHKQGEIVHWYKKHKDMMIFEDKTRKIIESIIDKIEKYYFKGENV